MQDKVRLHFQQRQGGSCVPQVMRAVYRLGVMTSQQLRANSTLDDLKDLDLTNSKVKMMIGDGPVI